MHKKLNEEIIKKIIEMYQAGSGSDTVGAAFGIHPNTVLKILKKAGLTARPWARKVPEVDFPIIVTRYIAGESSATIAKTYSVTNTVILKILEKQGCQRRAAEDTHRKYPLNEKYFDIIDTQEKAYILGFIYADGCNLKDYNYISIQLARKDIDILYQISERLFPENPHDRVSFVDRIKKGKLLHHAVITFNSKYMCGILDNLGCSPRKSLTLQFPNWLNDPELQRHFIRGYYDGDGGVYIPNVKNRSICAKIIGTYDFILKMNEIIFKNIKVGLHLEKIETCDLYRTHVSGGMQAQKFLDWLYKDSTIHLERKHSLYKRVIAREKRRGRIPV